MPLNDNYRKLQLVDSRVVLVSFKKGKYGFADTLAFFIVAWRQQTHTQYKSCCAALKMTTSQAWMMWWLFSSAKHRAVTCH